MRAATDLGKRGSLKILLKEGGRFRFSEKLKVALLDAYSFVIWCLFVRIIGTNLLLGYKLDILDNWTGIFHKHHACMMPISCPRGRLVSKMKVLQKEYIIMYFK